MLEMHDAIMNPSLGLRSAGVQRLARACVAQAPEFGPRLVERFPGDLGKVLGRWLKEERNRPVKGDGGRVDIVEQMERLAQRGIIDRPMRLPPPAPPARLAGRPPDPGQPALAPAAPPAGRKSEPALVSRGPVETIPTGPAAPRVAAPSAFMPTPRKAGASAEDVPAPEQGGSRVISMAGAPPARRPTAQVARPTSSIPARRDPVAERESRKAGASGTGQNPALSPRPNPRAVERTDPARPAVKRVLRDGKPLEEQAAGAAASDTLPPRRATAAPVVQGIPRRKERPPPADSPGPKGPGRGPGGGSR